MGYIKFILNRRETDDKGIPSNANISKLESDIADTSTLETNLLLHALSLKGRVYKETRFILNDGKLNYNILG